MPIRKVGVSTSVNLPLHHEVQNFSNSTGSPGWSRKKGRKTVVVVGGVNICYLLCYEYYTTFKIVTNGQSKILSKEAASPPHIDGRPYTLQWGAPSPLKIVPSHRDLDPI